MTYQTKDTKADAKVSYRNKHLFVEDDVRVSKEEELKCFNCKPILRKDCPLVKIELRKKIKNMFKEIRESLKDTDLKITFKSRLNIIKKKYCKSLNHKTHK